jgi:precorrin-3B methylase
MEKVKAPAGHQAYLEWVKSAISEFGASAFPLQTLAATCREEMENKNAGVRSAAVEMVGGDSGVVGVVGVVLVLINLFI